VTSWFRTSRAHPSAVLLAAQLLGVLIYPFLDESPTGRALLSLISLAVLVLAVRAVRATPAWTWFALLLGIPVFALTILEAIYFQNATIVLSSSLLHAAFYFYTTYGLLRYLFRDRIVTPDELWAIGATFTVLAWAFAYVYVAAQIVWPGSFIAAVDPSEPRTWVELLFLSFTTLTATGLSDVIPVLANARSLNMIEQVAGLMFVALVISRVVGLTLFRARAEGQRLS
jgi:Ion channel